MATADELYCAGFLPDSEVTLDGARGDAKFFTDTHGILSGELGGESGKDFFGLRRG